MWWKSFVENIEQTIVGKGTYNSVSVVDCQKALIKREFWEDLFPNISHPPEKLAIRKGHKPGLDKGDVVDEIFLQCYCAFLGLGPRLFAAFYTDVPVAITNNDNRGQQITFDRISTWCEERKEFHPNNKLYREGTVESTVSVSEAWTGSVAVLFKVWKDTQDFKSLCAQSNFSDKLVGIIHKASEAGIFHGDITPGNLLYRVSDPSDYSTLELCLTDFDPGYCLLIDSRNRTPEIQKCMTTATVAMFLGFLKCYDSVVYKHINTPVFQELERVVSTTLLGTDPTCDFLASVSGGRFTTSSSRLHSVFDRDVAQVFRTMVFHYAGGDNNQHNPGVYPNCFKWTSNESLFRQLLSYCRNVGSSGAHSSGRPVVHDSPTSLPTSPSQFLKTP